MEGIEFITVIDAQGAVEWVGVATHSGRTDTGQDLYVIHRRGHDRALPGYWTLDDGRFMPADAG